MVQVQKEAIQSVEQDGMVFIDEIDKIVVNHDSRYGMLWSHDLFSTVACKVVASHEVTMLCSLLLQMVGVQQWLARSLTRVTHLQLSRAFSTMAHMSV